MIKEPSDYSAILGEVEADYCITIIGGGTREKSAQGKDEFMHAMYAVAQNEKDWNRRQKRNNKKHFERDSDYVREKRVRKPRKKRVNPYDYEEYNE